MVYGVENHGLPYQTSTITCLRRENPNNLNVGVTCENFNSSNLIHTQIATTTTHTPRKRGSTSQIINSDGCNIDLSGLSREERRSELNN